MVTIVMMTKMIASSCESLHGRSRTPVYIHSSVLSALSLANSCFKYTHCSLALILLFILSVTQVKQFSCCLSLLEYVPEGEFVSF